jgi:membrane associated rhomboid family serine protease
MYEYHRGTDRPEYKFNVTTILVLINIGVHIIIKLFPNLMNYLALYTPNFLNYRMYWQILTYMFVHSQISFTHILFNMLGLFIFGNQLEWRMGSREFLFYYLSAGIGAGILALFLKIPVIGASGAIYALLLGFATYFPNAKILVFFFFPMKAPLAVLLFAGLSIYFQFSGSFGGVAHWAHLAGIVVGYLYFLLRLKINPVKVFLENMRR